MGLLKNELYKLIKMKKTYIFVAIMSAMTLLTIYVYYNGQEMGWQTVLQTGNIHALQIAGTTGLGQFMGIFIAIFVASIIAEEYHTGTIKLSLISPASRSQILRSKAIAIFAFNVYLLILFILSTYIIGFIAFGWSDSFMIDGVSYTAIEGVLLAFSYYGLYLIPFTAFGFASAFVAIATRDVMITIIISTALPFAGQVFYRFESIRIILLPIQMYFFPDNILNSTGLLEVLMNISVNFLYMAGFYFLSKRLIERQDIVI